ncbi:flagellar biosynthesis anti-sigma factor FlgM [Paludibacterium yongneupense]|uniref:flagellar biosynthesis anti-sigma factor FlgM n=1 Tax=Paludibacterium yongneupense TaxID=400061 RepID=UPI00040E766B|nr:flagellar biosynthesis anti-sigma factor FlgM [Paludibacterium yongneupense]
MQIDNSGKILGAYSAPQNRAVKRASDSDDSTSSVDGGSESGESSAVNVAPGSTVVVIAASRGDNVAINPLASRLSALSSQSAGEPSFDEAKVASIKAAIASGQFQIDPSRIADGLISSTQELLAS